MGASGMAVDANGKPIKRQNNNNGNKGGKNIKKMKQNGPQQNRNNQGGNNGRGNQRGRGNAFRGGPVSQPPMHMIPPFHPMAGPMGPNPMGPNPIGPPGPMVRNANFGFFNNKGGPKTNDNRNAAPPSGYFGPSSNTVGQSVVGGGIEPSMDVPGFGKNSNIHELFGKMVWRKMEEIRDSSVVDQLQNRIMNMIHDAIAQQDKPTNLNGNTGNPYGPNNNGLLGKAFNAF